MISLILALQFVAYVDGNYYQCGSFTLSPHDELYLKGDCHRITKNEAARLTSVPPADPDEFFCDDTPHLDPQRCGLEPRKEWGQEPKFRFLVPPAKPQGRPKDWH